MPDGEDTSDLSTTEEKDPDSDTSPTKPAARCSGIHAGVEAYDDELNYTDLSMKKSLYADKNLQLPSASTLSKHVRPETHPLCRDELEFHVGQIDCERDTKTDSAPPQEPRQERDGSTSNESLPQDPSKDDLTKPALKQKGMGKHPRHQPIQVQLQGGMRKRKKGKPTKKTASSPEVARRSRKKHKSQHQSAKVPPNGKNSSSSDESSKAQKRPNPATQGSSHKPASTTPVTVTSRKKSPPSGKCAKPQIRFAPDSIAESSKEEGNDPSFVTGHPLYNPAEDHPTTDRSSGDEIRLVTQPQSPDIEVFTEPKEGPFEIDGDVTEQIAKAGMKGVGVAENAQQDFHQESKLSIQAQDPKETVKEDPDELSSQNKEQYPKETTKEESDELSGRAKAQETTKEDPDELSGQTKAVDPKETAKEDPDELSGQTKAQETTKEDPDELSGQTKAQETTKEDPDELSGQTKAQETTKEDPDELSGQTKAQETTKEDPDELSGQTKAADPKETVKEDPDKLSGQTKAPDPKETAKEDPDELSGQTKAPDPKETVKEEPDELSSQSKEQDPKVTVKGELSSQAKKQDRNVTVKDELSGQAKAQDRKVPEATTNNPVIIKASLQIDVSATSKEPTLQDNCFPFLSLYGPQEQLIQPECPSVVPWLSIMPVHFVCPNYCRGFPLRFVVRTIAEEGLPKQMVEIVTSLLQAREQSEMKQNINYDVVGFDSLETLLQAVWVDVDSDCITVAWNHTAKQSLPQFIVILKQVVEYFIQLWNHFHQQDLCSSGDAGAISSLRCFIDCVECQVEVSQEATLETLKEILSILTPS